MITPFFTISQDDEFIYIDVKISHIRFSAPNIEMTVENELFVFSLPPYYLRLRFPYPCIEDDRSHAEYDSKTECVKIKIPKETKGQFFPDLDLTAKLLARTNEPKVGDIGQANSSKPLIEELDVDNTNPGAQAERDLAEREQFNWEVKQDVPTNPDLTSTATDNSDVNLKPIKYGFNNQYDNIVGVSVANGNDINELADPENTPENARIIERLIKENIKFDPEMYAADYIMKVHPEQDDENKNFKELIDWKNPLIQKFLKWYKADKQLPEAERTSIMPVEFSKEEQEKMMNLPRKSYLIDDSYKPEILLTTICLLFAYHFDLRENEGDHNIESAWTIGKIVPQFSFLDSKIVIENNYNVLRAAIITCIRRALTYPYHRNFDMITKVWDDVYYNLRGGKRLVVKALLDLKELFRFHDIYYVYDKIWLEDLCAYLISDNVSEATIRNLAHDIQKEVSSIKKADITFEKANLESAETVDDNEGNGEDSELIALSLPEIEVMAEEMFQQVQSQQ